MHPAGFSYRVTLPSPVAILIAALAGFPVAAWSADTPEALEPLRTRALADVFVLQDFRPGKLSFVESPERHVGQWTGQGFRYTLAELKGTGSIRHIWTTRGDGPPYFEWEFYVDGETTPSVRFTDEQMARAAEAYPVPVAPGNSLPVHNRAFNFFLPVPFERSLRLDVVQQQPTFWLWFSQIDYRLEDPSWRGARLFTRPEGTNVSFHYTGLPQARRTIPAANLGRVTHELPDQTLAPGQAVAAVRISGPAIGRELRLRWSPGAQLRLRVRYDDAKTFAVDAPVARFFGPFQGVSYFAHATNDASSYLPFPFRRNLELEVRNEGTSTGSISGCVTVEPVPAFGDSWSYLHTLHQRTAKTDGHRLHQVLYVRGRGHWLGMTLYHTGHDHGGGDFAVIDGEGERPAFLHGVNGEDYFTFAWFGKGAHHPYAVAHDNDQGRYRHHFENVYPFHQSLALEWGAFADLSPESVAVWYQDTPEDTTVPDGARRDSVAWDVFGPVPIPHDAAGRSAVDRFAGLPSVQELDAGRQFECRLVEEKFMAGWMKEWSVGPMLNLTYVARHGTKIDYEAELGGMGHAFLARRTIDSDQRRTVWCQFAHDDPIEVWLNGARIYAGRQHFNGFESTRFPLALRKGRNEVVIRLTNYFNRDFNWTGFLFRPET